MSVESRAANARGVFFRQCRLWHGYLSALSFLALLFFAATGLVLNHPEWTQRPAARSDETITLTAAEIAAIRAAPDKPAALTDAVSKKVALMGFAKDAEAFGESIFVRLQGANGSSDLRADLAAGRVEVSVERADTVGVLNALHRGALAGGPWRLAIDVVAVVLIVMALVGFALFVFMRQRLATALGLTAAGLAGAGALYVLFVR